MTTTFVGRTAELEVIEGLLAGLGEGRGGALGILGEAGIGKTRLLAELVERADVRGYLALSGAASELDRDVPFWVFADALDEYVRGLPPRVLAGLDGAVLAQLAYVLPAFADMATDAHPPMAHERYRSHWAVRMLLERLTATTPLVLVLDDLHWADSGSFELLLTLLRRPSTAPMLIVWAARPNLLPTRVTNGLDHVERAGRFVRLQLDALTSVEARQLLEALGRGALRADLLYRESGGNPFFLEQLARAVDRNGGDLTAEGGEQLLGGIAVPAGVAALLAEELGELSTTARLVVLGAAVSGDPFDPELAAAAAAITEAEALVALDEVLASDLVRATDVPRRFRFRHPLVQRAVYDSVPGGWRIAAHQRCAAALAERGAPVAALARHVELSARPGDVAAAEVLAEAGYSAAHRAPATAARWFEAALRFLPARAPPDERTQLLLAQAASIAATGDLAASHAVLLESVRLAPNDAVALRVRVTTKCAAVEHQLGRYVEARVRLEDVLEHLEDTGSAEAVGLMIELALNGLFQADFGGMDRWAGRAYMAAEPLNDPALTATALAVQAAGAAMVGASAAGRGKRELAMRMIDVLADDALADHLDAIVHLALAEMYLDHFEDCRRHADRALTLSRATGQSDYLAPIAATLGTSLWVRGRIAEAIEVLEGAVEAARLADDAQGLCWMLFNLSDAASAAGRLEMARSTAEESWQVAQSLAPGPLQAHAGSTLALAQFKEGRPSAAAELLMRAGAGEKLRMIGGPWRGRYLEILTRCFLEADRRVEAERAAAAARECAEAIQLPSARAMAELAHAALDLNVGDGDRAADRALSAIANLESVGHAYDAARARTVAGRALAIAGNSERAAAELARAAADFDSFGATRYRAEAEGELRKLGRTVYHRSAPGSGGDGIAALTERELQLARLVVDRKTNPQIAAELFLSQKTVETHLRNIFRKVGVRSRVELARAVERADHEAPN